MMRLEDFKKELGDAGWQAVGDAQHQNIKYLHAKLFPVVAELEQENFELDCVVSP
jgi:hypothetical protein